MCEFEIIRCQNSSYRLQIQCPFLLMMRSLCVFVLCVCTCFCANDWNEINCILLAK